MKKILIIYAIMICGCASTHQGSKAQKLSGNISQDFVISGSSIDRDLNSSFELIELTFENTSADWLRVHEAKIIIDDTKDAKVSVVVGKDLLSWAEAVEYQNKVNQHNTEIAIGTTQTAAAVALGVGAVKKDNTLSNLGAVGYLMTSGYAAAQVISTNRSNAMSSNGTPNSHLYEPFSVPAGLFMRKWLLLNKPAKTYINRLVLELNTVDGKKGYYEIQI